MITKNHADDAADQKAVELVSWGPQYQTGIAVIDRQHHELVTLTNELYRACRAGRKEAETVFKVSMSKLVEYVRFHFGYEQTLLERIGYPKYREHKTLHTNLVQKILEAAKDHGDDQLLVLIQFVRTLSDWIFGHIAIEDRGYAFFVEQLKAKGVLKDSDFEEKPGGA
jgi:hemerythrin-like metal-binding protein